MPLRPPVCSLREACLVAISTHYERICYGCHHRSQMTHLLDLEDEKRNYLSYPGPFTPLPSSLLEDLLLLLYDRRCLPKEMLHQLILPQLESYSVKCRTSRHIQTKLLTKNCQKLRSLQFAHSTNIEPTFYTRFFKNFPLLIRIDLEGTILDNEAFDSIGETCPQLRELNVSSSTVTDRGLEYLSVAVTSQGEVRPRCPALLSLNLEQTRCSASGVAQFLFYHPALLSLRYHNFSPVFQHFTSQEFKEFTRQQKTSPVFNLRHLSFADGPVSEAGFVTALSSCPLLASLVVRQTDLSNHLLADMMSLTNITDLHLGNSSFSQHSLHFDDGIIPLLWALGHKLRRLNLEKFNQVDILQLGVLCPRLEYLRLSCVGSYLPVFDFSQPVFTGLQELELLNTRGALIVSKALHQLLDSALALTHLKLQFVETLTDTLMSEILAINPLSSLETVTLDQCHSISLFTLESLVTAHNRLSCLACWSCRFITEMDRDLVVETLRNNNYQLHFSYYQFTGEEAPMPLDDIESDDEDENEDEDDEEDEEPDFLNYWTDPPIPTHRGPALD